jgi:hypothetical protein
MTPKEKAEELVEIYKKEVSITIKDYSLVCKVLDIDMAKQCALIAVDLAIEYNDFHIEFLQEVKIEIEKL